MPVTLRAIPAVAQLLAGPPLLDRSKGRRHTKRDTKPDTGSSSIISGLKHRTNDARNGSSSYSNRCDRSGLNGCCTAMQKGNGKTTTLSFFVVGLFPKTDISYARCFLWRQNYPEVNYSLTRISAGGWGVFLEEMSCRRYDNKQKQKSCTTQVKKFVRKMKTVTQTASYCGTEIALLELSHIGTLLDHMDQVDGITGVKCSLTFVKEMD